MQLLAVAGGGHKLPKLATEVRLLMGVLIGLLLRGAVEYSTPKAEIEVQAPRTNLVIRHRGCTIKIFFHLT